MRSVLLAAFLLAGTISSAFASDEHLFIYASTSFQGESRLLRAPLASPDSVTSWDLGGSAQGLAVTANGRFAFLTFAEPSWDEPRLVRWNVVRAEFDRDYGPADAGDFRRNVFLFHNDTRLVHRVADELLVINLTTSETLVLPISVQHRVVSVAGSHLAAIDPTSRSIQIYDARDESLRTVSDHAINGAMHGAQLVDGAGQEPQLWVFLQPSSLVGTRIARLDLESGDELDSLPWVPPFSSDTPPRLGLYPHLDRYCFVAGTALDCRRLSDGSPEHFSQTQPFLIGPAQALRDQWVLIDSGVRASCGFICPGLPPSPVRVHKVDVLTGSMESFVLDDRFAQAAFSGNFFVAGESPPAPIPSGSWLSSMLLAGALTLVAVVVLRRRPGLLASKLTSSSSR